jgi:hypothetical protein
MRNRDPRILLLILSFLPFVLWVGGVLLTWLWWKHPLGNLAGAVVFLSGFALVRRLDPIVAWIYRTHLRGLVADCPPDSWIPVDMERTGTQDQLHVLPDTVGIMQRTAAGLVLRELRGLEIRLARGQFSVANVSKSDLTCSMLFTDQENKDLIGFVVAPRCIGAPMEVAGYGSARFQWFLEWAQVNPAGPSPREETIQAGKALSPEAAGGAAVANPEPRDPQGVVSFGE